MSAPVREIRYKASVAGSTLPASERAIQPPGYPDSTGVADSGSNIKSDDQLGFALERPRCGRPSARAWWCDPPSTVRSVWSIPTCRSSPRAWCRTSGSGRSAFPKSSGARDDDLSGRVVRMVRNLVARRAVERMWGGRARSGLMMGRSSVPRSRGHDRSARPHDGDGRSRTGSLPSAALRCRSSSQSQRGPITSTPVTPRYARVELDFHTDLQERHAISRRFQAGGVPGPYDGRQWYGASPRPEPESRARNPGRLLAWFPT